MVQQASCTSYPLSETDLADVIMELMDQFIARYRKEYDFYDQAARLAAHLVEQQLQSAGIRAIVTSRAKSLTRLEEKVRQRAEKNAYQSVEDIFKDIVDLAGVRVALYFPGERDQVGKVITQLFALESDPKIFPEGSKKPSYDKRFSGYWATHYRVHLRDASLNDTQKRYGQALIEIQVASVLMHAWAEVEHDLVYKPQQGSLSEDEYAVLDELNGMVITGEIALEQLQRAGKQRVAAKGRKFSNHYDLADYLLDQAGPLLKTPDPETLLGRVNILYKLLDALGFATPDALKPYLSALSSDFERRPLADQIIDQLLTEDPIRYDTYKQIRRYDSGERRALAPKDQHDIEQIQQAMGRFLSQWIEFERQIRQHTDAQRTKPWLVPTTKVIAQLGQFDARTVAEIDHIRRFRNNLVHGVEVPSAADIEDATEVLESILTKLKGGW
jgi:ppGpp synthetase/RelA/SpoT-type nucleotidyltranferase